MSGCGSQRLAVVTFFGWKPTSTCWSRQSVRTSRPAPTRSTSARANSATTRSDRMRLPRRPDAPREPSLSASPRPAAGALEGGDDSEDDSRQERGAQGEEEDGAVDPDLGKPEEARRREPHEKVDAERGQGEPQGAARQSDDEALGQELPDEARARRRRAPGAPRSRAAAPRPARAAGSRRSRTRSGARGPRPRAAPSARGGRRRRGRPGAGTRRGAQPSFSG